ncbi:uncharacterized protein LOC129590091 [Paramacrobiotus metropolitanus]|uniref:uncharacterized protein LOC129590091 n=1 Tax=Paramacrobiotus metropolitanus TaxID=2943436 RepID=UPI002445DC63|nr:uncharacterized protein LOC129590091 [Paramacrobiotus metropolitanus]XP_055341062.1 uncharacterized protein LOC129590091 [Paramacrobiotus metropolitanus]XP_055341063.1 uncharacterized protein LOC129590091 [Paramacrobiotus metropolitanus]XP_055341064.1 uncharacterized protein LOC129590091 [Paramacrobiotus metropolitanus]
MSTDENDSTYKEAKEDVFITMERYKVKLPVGITLMLQDLTREVIREKPKNIFLFAADLFLRRIKERSEDVGPYGFTSSADHEFCKYRDKEIRDHSVSDDKSKTKSSVKRSSAKSFLTKPGSFKDQQKRSSERRPNPCQLLGSTRDSTMENDDVHASIFPVQARKLTRPLSFVSEDSAKDPSPTFQERRNGSQIARDVTNPDGTRRSVGIQEARYLVVPPPETLLNQYPQNTRQRSSTKYYSIAEESDDRQSNRRRSTANDSRLSEGPGYRRWKSTVLDLETPSQRRLTVTEPDRRRSRTASFNPEDDRQSNFGRSDESTPDRNSRSRSVVSGTSGPRASVRQSTVAFSDHRASLPLNAGPLRISDQSDPNRQLRSTSMVPTSEASVSTQTPLGASEEGTQVESQPDDGRKRKKSRSRRCC